MSNLLHSRLHLLSYSTRSWVIAGLMATSYTLVALGDSLGTKVSVLGSEPALLRDASSNLADVDGASTLQLLGVAASSLQGGLGEASCLALASFYDSRTVITYWSSGTGFAGTKTLSRNPKSLATLQGPSKPSMDLG